MVARPSSCPRRGVYTYGSWRGVFDCLRPRRDVADAFDADEAIDGCSEPCLWRLQLHITSRGEVLRQRRRRPGRVVLANHCWRISTATPYERWGGEETTRGVSKRTMWGYQSVQEEHDGLEEDRSDPEGRGAHGPARPT